FGLKERRDNTKDLITKEDYYKIREFIKKETITIRKADKSNTFVIMNRSNYQGNLIELLSDTSKFKKITSDPSDGIERDLNRLIPKDKSKSTRFSKITGHYETG
ncbi:hypothetical protein, partial [Solihabitans fulvus]|uniref:hypothetical protein n=1 Tax=Solihabitans fulvus TaxID=1892852 RepID=UPI001CB76484